LQVATSPRPQTDSARQAIPLHKPDGASHRNSPLTSSADEIFGNQFQK